jgi:hypothetical protein
MADHAGIRKRKKRTNRSLGAVCLLTKGGLIRVRCGIGYTVEIMDGYSAIDVTPMTNVENGDSVLHIIDLVYDTIIPNADAPPCTPRQGKTPSGSWILCQCTNRLPHAFIVLMG